ncbi:MAG TPA: hypothetical protein PLS53_01255 [Thermoanaerobaculaceae bacterium]|nr:hypothetical protein [Thermoanaerobaculaceae bacterium]HPS76763.1 hypothetical protein [Thermoanaerobaculaceae bacterium]
MTLNLPSLTTYDPPGTSEGTLDPLGLYQIADQLAVQLVPAVRERMQRIRYLTAMAVSALVTEGLEDDPSNRDASPYLVWEWLVAEAFVRQVSNDSTMWGAPGTQMARRAIDRQDYLDARSYLKTPRIFGFHGVYKRLATHLGVVDVHLAEGPAAEALLDAWARDLGFDGLRGARSVLQRWSEAVRRSLAEKPPRTRTGWAGGAWAELGGALAPSRCAAREKRCLRGLLLGGEAHRLGALPAIWELQPGFGEDDYREEPLHKKLEQREPGYIPLLGAIRAYEVFARSLQDAFDVLRAEAAGPDARGFSVPEIAKDTDFQTSIAGLHEQFEAAHLALGEVTVMGTSLQNALLDRFSALADPMDAAACALTLCRHHEAVQRAKSADGKRPWFDRLGQDRIYIRHAYRAPRPEIQPGRYVHDYRGWPIRRFWRDLS